MKKYQIFFHLSGLSNYMNYDFINIEKTGNDYKIIKSSIKNIVKNHNISN